MVYILGKNFNNDIKVLCMLKKFFGLNYYTASIMLNDLSISNNCRIKDLSQNVFSKIPKWIEKFKINIEDDLRQKVLSNILKLKSNKSYRGFRHIQGLPVRGQRTKTNSVTSKKMLSHVNKVKKS